MPPSSNNVISHSATPDHSSFSNETSVEAQVEELGNMWHKTSAQWRPKAGILFGRRRIVRRIINAVKVGMCAGLFLADYLTVSR